MPGPVARWGDETYLNRAVVNRRITNLPRGRVYFAGDTYGQVPGWQEGFVDTARLAIASILSRKPSTNPDLDRSGSWTSAAIVRRPRRVRVNLPRWRLPHRPARW